MFKDISLGQYLNTGSVIHKLDPRTKIIIIGIFMVLIFTLGSLVQYIPVVLGILLISYLGKIPPKNIARGVKPLKFIIIITFIINLLTTPGQEVFSFWRLSVSYEGIMRASFMALRLIFLVMGTSLLTLTTSPTQLTDGIESILSPLKRLGFPAHELAMMMTIALRFIPTLLEESDKIMKAQMARGADFESGNLIKRAQNLIPLLVPLFLNSLRRANDLAVAMESRCYRGGEGRTRLNALSMGKNDYIAMGLVILYALGLYIFGSLNLIKNLGF